MKQKRFLTTLAAVLIALTLVACSGSNNIKNTNSDSNISPTVTAAATSTPLKPVSAEYNSDDVYFNWKEQKYTAIDLSKGAVSVTQNGIYELSGKLADGSVTVQVDKNEDEGVVYLVLNNADISSTNSAPIFIKEAKKVVLILENGTANTIVQGSGVTADESGNPSAAVFSMADLTITGQGSLNVQTEYNDGITSKDDLKITDGVLVINAKADGIVGKDLLAVQKAEITITAGKDGMRATNDTDADKGNLIISNGTFHITSACDGVSAAGVLQIDGGTFEIIAGGGYTGSMNTGDNGGFGGRPGENTGNSQEQTDSKKGLKAAKGLILNNGSFNVSSADDALHSKGDVLITGGTVTLKSDDDGIHADAAVTVKAGKITIDNCYEGLEGINITFENGELNIVSKDDGYNVNSESGLLTINNGTVYMNAGGDGVDSNGSVVMTGGTVYVDGPTNDGNGAIDYYGTFTISGGTLVAAGSSGMAQIPQSGAQVSILMYYNTQQSAGTTLSIKDDSGNVMVAFTPQKQYRSAAISAPGLAVGGTYTLYKGEEQVVTFKIAETITYLDENGITSNQGRFPGGGQDPGGDRPGGNMPGGDRPGNGF